MQSQRGCIVTRGFVIALLSLLLVISVVVIVCGRYDFRVASAGGVVYRLDRVSGDVCLFLASREGEGGVISLAGCVK